jgi:hypothetical protein
MHDKLTGRFQRVEVNDHFLDEMSGLQAWFIGFMAADGCVKDETFFSISQSGERGLGLILEIKKMLNYNGKTYTNLNGHSIQICSKPIVQKLKEFNIVPRKSLIYEFPEQFVHNDLLDYFMRGYIDGDGSVGYYHTGTTNVLCLSFVGTEKFILRFHEITDHAFRPRKIKSATNLYEARYYGERAIKFGRWLWGRSGVPSYYKEEKFREVEQSQRPKYVVYDEIRGRVFDLIQEGCKPMDAARRLGIPFQSVYRWIKTGRLIQPQG